MLFSWFSRGGYLVWCFHGSGCSAWWKEPQMGQGLEAATLIMILSFLIILLPIGGLVNMLTSKGNLRHHTFFPADQGIEKFNQQIQQSTGMNLMTDARLQKLQETITNVL